MSGNVGALVGLAALGVATGGFGLIGAGAAGAAGAGEVAAGASEIGAGAIASGAGDAMVAGAGTSVFGAGAAGAAAAGGGGMLSSIGSGIKAALPYAQGVSAAASLIGAITARRPGGLPMAPTPSPTPLLANPSDAAIQSQKNAMIASLVARGGRQSTILTTPASGTQLGG